MPTPIFSGAAIVIVGIIGFCMTFQAPILGLGLMAFAGFIAYKVVRQA